MKVMKDSGIDWIGAIPNDWDVRNVKSAFLRKKSKAQQENPVILSLARNSVKIRDISSNEGQVAESYYDYNPVEPGDFLLNPMDLYSGANCNVSEIGGVISPAYVNLKANKDIDPKFYDYYFKTQYWSMALFAHGMGVSFDNRWTLNAQTLMNYKIPIPQYTEQLQISKYLNRKVAYIDSIIEKTKESMDDYKKLKQSIITETVTKGLNHDVAMRDSGIEWIGKIPKHWIVLRGKYVLEILNKPVLVSDEIITCFRDGEVTLRKNRKEDGFTMADKEIGYQGIDIGDLVIHGMDGFAGSIGISDSRGKATPVLNICDSKYNKKYLMYYLRSMAYSNVFLATSTGIRVRSCDLSWNKLANFPFPISPMIEQNLIVRYIDGKLSQIDKAIEVKTRLLESIEDYRKSLIYEVVTGKKEAK